MALHGILLMLTGIWLTTTMCTAMMCRYTFVCTVDKDTLNCTTKTCTDNCQKKFSSADLGLNLTGKTTRFMCTDTYHGNSDSCPKNCRLIPSISTTITATITKTCPTTVSNPQQKRNNHHLCTTILTQSTTTTTITSPSTPTTNRSILSTSYGGKHCVSTTTTITITPSFSPTMSTAESSNTPGATHGGYIAVILVLLAIIITLVVLVGYLVRRTTAQRGTVQTTEQPPTDMAAAAAGDYCEPIALRQLQTSTEPEIYSEPADTLNHLHSATNRQGTPSCHVNPSYEGAPSCQVNPSYEGTPVTNGHSVLQQRPSSHPPLPDPPTDDSNTEYSKPVEMDNLPPLAENDYEVLEEVRREKEKSQGKLE